MRLGKVYHDLEKSKYIVEYSRFKFIFSSKFYIEKFKKELYNYIENESIKITHRYSSFLESDEFLALSLYKRIEKRGFKVYFENEEINENTTFILSLSTLNLI